MSAAPVLACDKHEIMFSLSSSLKFYFFFLLCHHPPSKCFHSLALCSSPPSSLFFLLTFSTCPSHLSVFALTFHFTFFSVLSLSNNWFVISMHATFQISGFFLLLYFAINTKGQDNFWSSLILFFFRFSACLSFLPMFFSFES